MCKPYVSIRDGRLKTCEGDCMILPGKKTTTLNIKVEYEPTRRTASMLGMPQIVPVKVNGKKQMINYHKKEMEHYL